MDYGGAIYLEKSDIFLQNVTIADNFAKFGGGIFYQNSYPNMMINSINNSLLSNNIKGRNKATFYA